MATLGFGLQPPKGTEVAWGARAIYDARDKFLDLVHDRQDAIGGNEERAALSKWLNNEGLPRLRTLLLHAELGGGEDITLEVHEGGYELHANPRASYGYLYLGAWPK